MPETIEISLVGPDQRLAIGASKRAIAAALATAADRVQTDADRVQTDADAAKTAADRAQVAIDRADADVASAAAIQAKNLAQGYAGALVAQGSVPIYPSRAAAAGLPIPAGIISMRTHGFAAVGDWGGALYMRVSSNLGAGCFRTADRFMPDGTTDATNGGYWQIVTEGRMRFEQFGGFADGVLDSNNNLVSGTDNLPAWQEMLALCATALSVNQPTYTSGPGILMLFGNRWFSGLHEPHTKFDLLGLSSITAQSGRLEGSVWIYPKSQGALIIQDSGTTGRDAKLSTATTTAGGSWIKGVSFFGAGASTDLTAHAIQLRTSATLEVKIYYAAGNGIHIVGYTNGSGNGPYGNVNGCDVTAYIHTAGGDGLHNQGSDANASKFYVATHTCGGVGFYNGSYYANTILLGDIAGYGNTGVWHNGVVYMLVDPYSANTAYNGGTPTAGGATEPGTNEAVWKPQGTAAAAGGRYPAWVSGGTYYLQQPWFDTGSGSQWPSGYIEASSIPQVVNAPSFTTGGTVAGPVQPLHGPTVYYSVGAGSMASSFGIGGVTVFNVASAQYANSGGGAYEVIGGFFNGYARHRLYNNMSSGSSRNSEYYINGNRRHAVGDPGAGGYVISWQTGAENALGDSGSYSGRGSHQQSVVGFPLLALGSGGYNANNRIIQYGTTVPTSGDFATGEIRFNLLGTGGYGALYCLSGGALTTTPWAANTSYNNGSIVTLNGSTYVAVTAPQWVAGQAYNVGDVITIISNNRNYRLVCTAAGTAAASGNGPIFTSVGASITDGTVTWQITTAKSGTTGPSGTGSAIVDGTVLWAYRPTGFTFVKWGELFMDYAVAVAATTIQAGKRLTVQVACAIAAMKDFAEMSYSADTQGMATRARVNAVGSGTADIVNDTGADVPLAAGTLTIRIKKAA